MRESFYRAHQRLGLPGRQLTQLPCKRFDNALHLLAILVFVDRYSHRSIRRVFNTQRRCQPRLYELAVARWSSQRRQGLYLVAVADDDGPERPHDNYTYVDPTLA